MPGACAAGVQEVPGDVVEDMVPGARATGVREVPEAAAKDKGLRACAAGVQAQPVDDATRGSGEEGGAGAPAGQR